VTVGNVAVGCLDPCVKLAEPAADAA
jgi:hypothetical protein